jgi:ribosome maturation factor RimP
MAQRGRAAGRAGSGPRAGARRGEGHDGRDTRAQAPRVDLVALRARLRAVVEPVVEGAGYDLEDLTVSRAGRRHVVRVVLDRDGGLDLDAVADVAREVSAALDAAEEKAGELVAGEYQLEVGSPGVDRPLTLPRHWRRNVGRLVKVGTLTGRIVSVDDVGVLLDVDGGHTLLAHADLHPGRVQVEFNRVEDPADDDLDGVDDALDDAGAGEDDGADEDEGEDEGR